jgi:hypothetical protein
MLCGRRKLQRYQRRQSLVGHVQGRCTFDTNSAEVRPVFIRKSTGLPHFNQYPQTLIQIEGIRPGSDSDDYNIEIVPATPIPSKLAGSGGVAAVVLKRSAMGNMPVAHNNTEVADK